MAKISLQFHATKEELLNWTSDWALEHGLGVAVEQFFPEARWRAVKGDLSLAIEELGGGCDRIWLFTGPVEIGQEAGVVSDEQECMTLTPGRLSSEGLRESALGANSEDKSVLSSWRKILKSAKLAMLEGAWVVNPVSGARVRAKAHYFTKGALELSQAGTRMLASAGWNEFELDAEAAGTIDRASVGLRKKH